MNTTQLLVWYSEHAVLIALGFGLFLSVAALRRAWQDLSSVGTESAPDVPPQSPQLDTRHCSLEIRQAEIPSTCCFDMFLFHYYTQSVESGWEAQGSGTRHKLFLIRAWRSSTPFAVLPRILSRDSCWKSFLDSSFDSSFAQRLSFSGSTDVSGIAGETLPLRLGGYSRSSSDVWQIANWESR